MSRCSCMIPGSYIFYYLRRNFVFSKSLIFYLSNLHRSQSTSNLWLSLYLFQFLICRGFQTKTCCLLANVFLITEKVTANKTELLLKSLFKARVAGGKQGMLRNPHDESMLELARNKLLFRLMMRRNEAQVCHHLMVPL